MKKILLMLLVAQIWLFADVKTVEVTPESFNDDMQIIDIRTKQEQSETGTIKNSFKVSFTDEEKTAINPNFVEEVKAVGIDPEKPVALICNSGNRSRMAAKVLDKAGFKDIKDLNGGIKRLERVYNYELIKD